MSEKIYQLVYTSKASRSMDLESVKMISDKAEEANKRNGVTGILIYRDGFFLQLLEGDKYNVHYTFKKINDDNRHTSVKVLIDKEVNSRLFPRWNMVFRNLDDADPELRSQIIELLQDKSKNPLQVLNALWSFYGLSTG